MKTVNIHDAKTQLSRLIAEVEAGESVTIARRGVPVVRLVPVQPADPGDALRRRTGFLPDIEVPDDFDTMGAEQIAAAFEDRA